MEQKDISALATAARAAITGGKAVDPKAVLELIEHHNSIVRAEAFWGTRGPQMVSEVSRLREVETAARAMLAHGRTIAQVYDGAAEALAGLDAHRAGKSA